MTPAVKGHKCEALGQGGRERAAQLVSVLGQGVWKEDARQEADEELGAGDWGAWCSHQGHLQAAVFW